MADMSKKCPRCGSESRIENSCKMTYQDKMKIIYVVNYKCHGCGLFYDQELMIRL